MLLRRSEQLDDFVSLTAGRVPAVLVAHRDEPIDPLDEVAGGLPIAHGCSADTHVHRTGVREEAAAKDGRVRGSLRA